MSNAWVSSPSQSLGASSSESPSASALLVFWHVALTLPYRLWDAYVAYLWYYQPSSWVSRIASTFRVLAFVLVFPVVLLTLLDVTSYVIARTLGVVDDVKASTSDADTAADERHTTRIGVGAGGVGVGVGVAVPGSTRVHESERPARRSEGLVPEDSVEGQNNARGDGRGRDGGRGGYEDGAGRVSSAAKCAVHASTEAQTETHTQTYYFAGEENLRLAGEGVFSPAVTAPPSPLTPRMPLHTFAEIDGRGSGRMSDEDGNMLRRRMQGARENELVL